MRVLACELKCQKIHKMDHKCLSGCIFFFFWLQLVQIEMESKTVGPKSPLNQISKKYFNTH